MRFSRSARSEPGASAAALAGAGGLLLVVAFTFDAAPLFVVGCGLVVLGLGAPAWVWLGVRGVSLERHLEQDRVVEEEPLETIVTIHRGVLGVPGAELRDPLASEPVAMAGPLSLIRGGRHARVRIVTRYSRRGLHRLAPPSIVARDPLGLFSRSISASGRPLDLLVLPRTEPVRWRPRQRGERAERAGGRAPGDPLAAVDVDGLRPYRIGSPASRIHWQSLARGAGLLERRLRADGDVRPLVVLDPRGADGAPLDAAVRAAASLTLELARRSGCRLLIPGERRPLTIERDLVAWPAAHSRLALVNGGPRAPAPMLAPGSQAGAVFYVAARARPKLPAALRALLRGMLTLVLPADIAPATGIAFEVSGCVGVPIHSRNATAQELVA